MLKLLKKGLIVIIVLLITGCGIGLTYTYNYVYETYSLNFSYDSSVIPNLDYITSDENIKTVQEVKYSYFTGGSISAYSSVEPKSLTITDNGEYYTLSMSAKSLKNIPSTANEATTAKGFLKHLAAAGVDKAEYDSLDYKQTKQTKNGDVEVTIKGVTTLYTSYGEDIVNVTDTKTKKMVLWSIIGGLIGLAVGVTLVIILGLKFKDKLETEDIYDNEKLFKTPFHKKYWSLSLKEFKSVRKMVIMAVLLGLTLVFKLVKIPSGFGNLGFGFGLIFLSVACMIVGPVPALLIGAISDTLGFFIEGGGMFFPGYTIQAMLSCFIYGLFLYRTKISYTKVLLSRVFINIICNVIIGSICWGIISEFTVSQTMNYLLTISLPKNIAYLIPQSIIMYLVVIAVVPIASQTNFIDEEISNNISIF